MIVIPERFSTRMVLMYGTDGARWLLDLPDRLAQYASRWGVRLGEPFLDLSYNYVLRGDRAGEPVVIKAGFPAPELGQEITALKAYAGRGTCRLLESDLADGIMLLEQVTPGETLAEASESPEYAAQSAGELLPLLHKANGAGLDLPDLPRWTAGLERLALARPPEMPEHLIRESLSFRDNLLADPEAAALLHGDFHHFNILKSSRGSWLAIDPKGVIGDPAFDAAAFMMNVPTRDPEVIRRCLATFCRGAGLDEARALRWAAAYSVLSTWWTLEDHGELEDDAIELASLVHGMAA